MAVLLEAPRDPKKPARKAGDAVDKNVKLPGTELLLIDAPGAGRRSFKDVADFVWTRSGERLAFAVSVKDEEKAAPASPPCIGAGQGARGRLPAGPAGR